MSSRTIGRAKFVQETAPELLVKPDLTVNEMYTVAKQAEREKEDQEAEKARTPAERAERAEAAHQKQGLTAHRTITAKNDSTLQALVELVDAGFKHFGPILRDIRAVAGKLRALAPSKKGAPAGV